VIAEHILNAVAHKNRPDSDRERDANRKPGEVLDFFNIKTTDKVGEINSGRGYLSSILLPLESQDHLYSDGGPHGCLDKARPNVPRPPLKLTGDPVPNGYSVGGQVVDTLLSRAQCRVESYSVPGTDNCRILEA